MINYDRKTSSYQKISPFQGLGSLNMFLRLPTMASLLHRLPVRLTKHLPMCSNPPQCELPFTLSWKWLRTLAGNKVTLNTFQGGVPLALIMVVVMFSGVGVVSGLLVVARERKRNARWSDHSQYYKKSKEIFRQERELSANVEGEIGRGGRGRRLPTIVWEFWKNEAKEAVHRCKLHSLCAER